MFWSFCTSFVNRRRSCCCFYRGAFGHAWWWRTNEGTGFPQKTRRKFYPKRRKHDLNISHGWGDQNDERPKRPLFFLTERNEIWDYVALATLGRHKLKFCSNKILAHFCWVRKLVRMKRVYSSGLAGANYHFHVVFSPKLKAVSLRRWVRLLVNGPFIVGSTSS